MVWQLGVVPYLNADPLAAGERKDGNAEERRNSWSEPLECALGHG